MKKLLSVLAITLFTTAVYAQEAKETYYGKKFETGRTMDVAQFSEAIKNTDKMANVRVKGTLSQVCQSAGCWVRLKNTNGEDVFVKFKDHFTIPMDLTGATATVYGTASKKTVSVADQRHFAEDAGKSEEEIAKIKEPKDEIRIDATGILIQQ
eukprot:TRINITY_DN100435_c0_g1_i1.p1 TRINITY_DN100435_c0_g1~~TRINITY_DN100435_c0_g1_i1.p1  ORF type:complete len:153 (-),score=23.10 TRINITY_DN100435_c0_g1_i1:30-488(-)